MIKIKQEKKDEWGLKKNKTGENREERMRKVLEEKVRKR